MRPYLRAANVTWRGVDLSDVLQMNFTDAELAVFRLLPGDILVNEASGSPTEVGKAAMFHGEIEDCAFQNTIIRVRPQSVSGRFLLHFLTHRALSGAYIRGSRGVGINHIGVTGLAAMQTPVPTREEQNRIVETLEEQLTRLDATIAGLRKATYLADKVQSALLSAAFSGRLGSAVQASEEQWPVRALNELVDDKSDIVDGPFGSNLKSEHYQSAGARVVRLQNIGYGSYIPADAFISLERYASLAKHNVQAGDLLFASLGNDLPRTCLAPHFAGPAIVKADCIRVRLSPSVNARFVLLATMRPEARTWAQNVLHGLGRPRLGLSAIRSFPVPWPTDDQQASIVETLDEHLAASASAVQTIDEQVRRAATLRRTLLHSAFTGKLTEKWREKHHG